MLALRAQLGGERVGPGDYWQLSTGERVHMTTPGILPGVSATRYYRLPAFVILLGAPVAGLVYALFLPFIALAAFVGAVAVRLTSGVVEGLTRVASFGWRPSEAYLLGRRRSGSSKSAKHEHTANERSQPATRGDEPPAAS